MEVRRPNDEEEGGEARILHLVFMLDCSGSMQGERIGSLNYAIRSAIPAIQEAARDHPGVRVMVRVLRFGDDVDWRVAEAVPIESFVWSNAEAVGETNLGAAFRVLAGTLASVSGSALPPVIVLVSDGYPTDDARGGLEALLATDAGSRAIRIPIAIGQDADLDLLQAFIGDPALKPLRANTAETLVGRVKWAALVPLAEASKGESASVAAIAGQAPASGQAAEAAGDLIW